MGMTLISLKEENKLVPMPVSIDIAMKLCDPVSNHHH